MVLSFQILKTFDTNLRLNGGQFVTATEGRRCGDGSGPTHDAAATYWTSSICASATRYDAGGPARYDDANVARSAGTHDDDGAAATDDAADADDADAADAAANSHYPTDIEGLFRRS